MWKDSAQNWSKTGDFSVQTFSQNAFFLLKKKTLTEIRTEELTQSHKYFVFQVVLFFCPSWSNWNSL